MPKRELPKPTASENAQRRRAQKLTQQNQQLPALLQNAEKKSEFVRGARLSQSDDADAAEAELDFSEITDSRKRTFLRALCRSPRYSYAAKKAGVSVVTTRNWRLNTADTAFQTALAAAFSLGVERAESELWRRGIEGYEKPVYHAGKLVGTELLFDTTAAIFMLKGALPEKYRERYDASVSARVDVQTLNVFTTLSTEEIERRLQQTAALLGAETLSAAQSREQQLQRVTSAAVDVQSSAVEQRKPNADAAQASAEKPIT
jgi:hypothetical protein